MYLRQEFVLSLPAGPAPEGNTGDILTLCGLKAVIVWNGLTGRSKCPIVAGYQNQIEYVVL